MNPYSNKVFANFQFKHPESPQELISQEPECGKPAFSVRRAMPVIFLMLILLVLCILLLPWPTRISLSLPGGRIDADGTLLEEGSIQVVGWQYNYLFRQDKMKAEVQVPDLTLSQTIWQKESFHANTLGPFRHMVQSIYVNELGSYQLSHISIALDNSWFLVQIGPNLYFGSSDPQMDAAAIVNTCRLVIQ